MSHSAAEKGINLVGTDDDETWEPDPEPRTIGTEPEMTPEEVEKFLTDEEQDE